MPQENPSPEFQSNLAALVSKFERNYDEYMRPGYSEADARSEFIDPLFAALGWDLRDTAGRGLAAREVVREKREFSGRSDYRFRVDGRTSFFVEAKAPHAPLDNTAILQAKKYAWSEPDPRNIVYFVVLTNFREFYLYDASRKPDPKFPLKGQVFELSYKQYLSKAGLENLWLLSRGAVPASLERLLTPAQRAARERTPLDLQFLNDLTAWREQLAEAVHNARPDLTPIDLNRVVQTFLDRLIFIRVAEDRGVLPSGGLVKIARDWAREGRTRPIAADLLPLFHQVKSKLNGEIFRSSEIEELTWDSALVAKIIEQELEPYDFSRIPVELLGSIYERYLGNTIRITGKHVKLERKPEVQKAGGVYYTPKYIVDYIIANTVGKLIEGKTPRQIAKLKFLDPACGSGSFLLGTYQMLLDYHTHYKRGEARGRASEVQHPRLLDAEAGGEYKLSLQEKADILRNNIFGIDIDAQAVEITMMSLYIKMLEDERGAITGTGVLPRLKDNIKCGNSLIAYDISDEQPDLSDEEKIRINRFDWYSDGEGFGAVMRGGGFDAVIGNPPYIRIQVMKEWAPLEVEFYKEKYEAAHAGNYDIYVVFVEKALSLLNKRGRMGFILPNKFFNSKYGEPIRSIIAQGKYLAHVVHFGANQVFAGATTYTALLFLDKA